MLRKGILLLFCLFLPIFLHADPLISEEPVDTVPDDLNITQSVIDDFLNSMDRIYDYGTAAVIVVGSAVDSSLFWIMSDENVTKPSTPEDLNRSDENLTIYDRLMTNMNDDDVETYVEKQEGKTSLPRQVGHVDWRKGERTYLMSQWFDETTINDGFLNMENRSYVRLRGGYAWDYRDENEWIYSIAARIKIPKTKKKLDLIIGDETRNTVDKSLEGTAQERDNSLALAFDLIRGYFDFVDAEARIGFSRIDNPYAKISFQSELLYSKWLIAPSQHFRYSNDSEFEEWTNLEFKRRIAADQLASILLQRSTVSRVKGMNYLFQPSISLGIGPFGVVNPFVGLYGRTKEQPEGEDGYRPKRGVYRYAMGINWSKQAERKYIVYRLQPAVAYDDRYDFQPNYEVKVLLEIYFGLRE